MIIRMKCPNCLKEIEEEAVNNTMVCPHCSVTLERKLIKRKLNWMPFILLWGIVSVVFLFIAMVKENNALFGISFLAALLVPIYYVWRFFSRLTKTIYSIVKLHGLTGLFQAIISNFFLWFLLYFAIGMYIINREFTHSIVNKVSYMVGILCIILSYFTASLIKKYFIKKENENK